MDLGYLEGRKFCVVFFKTQEEEAASGQIKMKCLHGRANIDKRGSLTVEAASGSFKVPTSAYPMIQPSDGTKILRDAEYFVLCKLSDGLDL